MLLYTWTHVAKHLEEEDALHLELHQSGLDLVRLGPVSSDSQMQMATHQNVCATRKGSQWNFLVNNRVMFR